MSPPLKGTWKTFLHAGNARPLRYVGSSVQVRLIQASITPLMVNFLH